MMRPRTAVRALQGLRDRALHGRRRKAALRALAGRPIRRVLILCHANICRSPFAAASLSRHLQALGHRDVEVSSAGVVGSDESAPPEGIEVSAAMGLDLSTHKSQLVTSTLLRGVDLIVVMSGDQAADVRWRGAPASAPVIVLGDLDPLNGDDRTILDPWKGSTELFRESYGRIDRCIRQLAIAITTADAPNVSEATR